MIIPNAVLSFEFSPIDSESLEFSPCLAIMAHGILVPLGIIAMYRG
jgi:hypothetical protein